MRLLRSATWPTVERGPAVNRSGEEIDLVLLQQLFGLAHGDGRVGLLVLEQQLERTAVRAAARIDLLDGESSAPTHLLTDRRIAARERGHHSDLDRIGCVGVRPEAGCECDDRSAA